MDGGDTRKRCVSPPYEKPMSCVDITKNHWSETVMDHQEMNENSMKGLAAEIVVLIVEDSLNSNDIRRVS